MRYALEGGKRIRAVICLATAEAAGGEPEAALPAAAALELVHAFSLVHDDLPALDDDDERRGRPSAHVAFGEGVALLAGDGLLVEAFRLALTYPSTGVGARARRGDARDDRRPVPRHHGRRRRPRASCTGSRRDASSPRRSGSASGPPAVPEADQAPWRAFGEELGMLFQVVDDILDGDGYAERLGVEEARPLADAAAIRPTLRWPRSPADTSVLAEIVDSLAVRTA